MKPVAKKKRLSLNKKTITNISIVAGIVASIVAIFGFSVKDFFEWYNLQKSVSKNIKALQRNTETIRICDIPESISSYEEVRYIQDYQTCFVLLQEEYLDIQNEANAAISIKDMEQRFQHLLESEIRLAQLAKLSQTLIDHERRYLLFLDSARDESLALSTNSLTFFKYQFEKKKTSFDSFRQEVEDHLDNTMRELQIAFQQASPESQIKSASKVLSESLKNKADWEFLERANDIHKSFMSFCNARIIDLYIYHSQTLKNDTTL